MPSGQCECATLMMQQVCGLEYHLLQGCPVIYDMLHAKGALLIVFQKLQLGCFPMSCRATDLQH